MKEKNIENKSIDETIITKKILKVLCFNSIVFVLIFVCKKFVVQGHVSIGARKLVNVHHYVV